MLERVQHWPRGGGLDVLLHLALPAGQSGRKVPLRHGALPADPKTSDPQASDPKTADPQASTVHPAAALHRIYVDLPGVRAAAQLPARLASRWPPLAQMRLGSPRSGTTRLVLDLHGPWSYRLTREFRGRLLRLRLSLTTTAAKTPSIPSSDPPPVIAISPGSMPPAAASSESLHDADSHDAGSHDHSLHDIRWHHALGLKIRTIALDPGHGGHDPGAKWGKLLEKDLVLDICRRVRRLARHRRPSLRVVLTRETDRFIPLRERPQLAEAQGADLFVSVHVNAHAKRHVHGVETYYLDFTGDQRSLQVAARENALAGFGVGELDGILTRLVGRANAQHAAELAEVVQENLAKTSGRTPPPRNLGVKQAPFLVLVGSQIPAILVEVGFLSNRRERRLLRQESYRQHTAEALYQGLIAYVDALDQRSLEVAQGTH